MRIPRSIDVGTILSRIARLVLRLVLLVAIPATGLAVALYLYAESGRWVETENAYVKAGVVAVSADVSGRAIEVAVEDNERVRAGDLLFRLDPEPFRIALDGAEAELALVRTRVEILRAEYREALARLAEEHARIPFLERQHDRQKRLLDRGMGSEERHDEALQSLEIARQRLRLLREQVERTLLSLGGDPELPVERHARYLKAKAARDDAARGLADTVVRAAADGVVSNVRLESGEYVEEGEPVFGLVEAEPVWIEANLKETQLTHVREGQEATAVVDAYPDRTIPARVGRIAPATGAEFAVLPPQNASGNWVKVVQRLPVILEIEPEPGTPELRAGMTVTVRIDTGRERALPPRLRELAGERDWLAIVRRVGRDVLAGAGLSSPDG